MDIPSHKSIFSSFDIRETQNRKRSNDEFDEKFMPFAKKYLPDHYKECLETKGIESYQSSPSLPHSVLAGQKRKNSDSELSSDTKIPLLYYSDEKSDALSKQKESVRDCLNQWKKVQIYKGNDATIVNHVYGLLMNLLFTKDIFPHLIKHADLEFVIAKIAELEKNDKLTNEIVLSVINSQYYYVPLNQLLSKLNYNPDKKGMCYGIAWTAMTSCLRHGGLAYMKRMHYLSNTPHDLICTQAEIPKDPYQLYPYFDTVAFSMRGYYDENKKPFGCFGSQSIQYPNILLDDNTDEPEFACPSVKDRFVAHVTDNDIILWLKALKDNNPREVFSVMVIYTSHAVSIGFDSNQWLAVNNNHHLYTNQLSYAVSNIFDLNYAEFGKIIAVFEVTAPKNSVLITKNQQRDQLLKTENLNKNNIKTMLFLSLLHGLKPLAHELINTVLSKYKSEKEIIELLLAKRDDGYSGLSIAMSHGQTDTVQVFVETVLQSDLPDEVKERLLSDGHGLCSAMIDGHTDTVKVFVNEVLKSNLSNLSKVRLLKAKNMANTTALSFAARYNRIDNVHTFLKEVKESNLPDNLKLDLMTIEKIKVDCSVQNSV